MTTLISFLGKGQGTGHYNLARYRFEDGVVDAQPYFAIALARRLRPATMLLVGTAGSAWDIFFEREAAADDEARLRLLDALEQGEGEAALMAALADPLAARLGARVQCLLIDEARDEPAQARLLHTLAAKLAPGERVVLDVTHSFRHLPMLALVAARYLEKIRRVTVEDIYYGALEMKDATGCAPVLRLGGLLRMLAWVDALGAYEQSGDYGAFAGLLAAEGLPRASADALRNAAYLERIGNSEGAKGKLTNVRDALATHDAPLGALFRDELISRLMWATEGLRGERELALARAWLARGDYLRATIYLQEGLVTSATYARRGRPNDRSDRESARAAMHEKLSEFKLLERLRNSLAHGQRAEDERVHGLLAEEHLLRAKLEDLVKQLPARLAEMQFDS